MPGKSSFTNKKRVASAHSVETRDEVDRSRLRPRREKLEGEKLVFALAPAVINMKFLFNTYTLAFFNIHIFNTRTPTFYYIFLH